MSRCKLLYIGWINNKVLPYSTGYPVINHNGKEYIKEKNVKKNTHFKAIRPKNKTDRLQNLKKRKKERERIQILLEFLPVLWDSRVGLWLAIQF